MGVTPTQMPPSAVAATSSEKKRNRRKRSSGSVKVNAETFGVGFIVKLILMALINALGVYIIWSAWAHDQSMVMWAFIVILVVVDFFYFWPGTLASKYLIPGLVFLMIYQIFTIVYTGYISFTNYGTGHNGDKQAAISSILAGAERRVEGGENVPMAVVIKDKQLALAVVRDDEVSVGWEDHPLEPVEATLDNGRISDIEGWRVVPFNEVLSNYADEVPQLRAPISDDPSDGSYRTTTGSTAFPSKPTIVYDKASDTLFNKETGVTYHPSKRGYFVSEDGTDRIRTGWRVPVGLENYTRGFTDTNYTGPLLKVFFWTVAFSFLSVATTFLLGLFLAIVFNDERVKGRKVYRALLILPYAFPGFLSALLWKGMLNKSFGMINTTILGGVNIDWLGDPWLAKLSILGVNLWLGFPYMFLVATAALQSIPSDLREAALIDGAGPWDQFRRITFPLVLIATSPLLIASFAFNFNNFNLIYMLTGGGPSMYAEGIDAGHTDLLITLVYKMSGLASAGDKDFGFASALSLVIFLFIAVVSVIGFRQSRKSAEVI